MESRPDDAVPFLGGPGGEVRVVRPSDRADSKDLFRKPD